MMHRLRRYDVMLRIMMLLVSLAMMRCSQITLGEADIISVGNIISVSVIICRRQTSLKKVTFVLVDKSDFFVWWKRVDSNHRSYKQQIYSLPPLATRELFHTIFKKNGAGDGTRTRDLLITNQLLYQLSYASTLYTLKLVGVKGFEPPAPWSQTKCATKLRQTPTYLRLRGTPL